MLILTLGRGDDAPCSCRREMTADEFLAGGNSAHGISNDANIKAWIRDSIKVVTWVAAEMSRSK